MDDEGATPPRGLCFQASDGTVQVVPAAALEQTFGAAGSSVRLVVLSACYSEPQAAALLAHVDCVIGADGALLDDDARQFAIGFYGGLGDGESIEVAFEQGRAAISLARPSSRDQLRLMARAGVDPSSIVLARARDQRRTGRRRPDRDPSEGRAGFSARDLWTSAITAASARRYALDVGGLGAVVSLMLVGLALNQCAPSPPSPPSPPSRTPIVHGQGSGQVRTAPPSTTPVGVASPIVTNTAGNVNISYGTVEQTTNTGDVVTDARSQ
jgi:hypothetical protein